MERMSVPADHGPEFVAAIGFEPAFSVTLNYDQTVQFETPHGGRIHRKISGGTVSGRLDGTVYPNGGGEYSLLREDGVTDIRAHVLLRAPDGEWIYLHNMGYRRPDGYYRVTSWVDADVRGEHDWVLGLFFIGKGRPSDDGEGITIDYYEVT